MMIQSMRCAGNVQRNYFRMPHQHLVIVKRWKNKSSTELKEELRRLTGVRSKTTKFEASKLEFQVHEEFEKFQKENRVQNPECQDLLSRTRVVTDCGESAKIVGKILKERKPIGVDLEGVSDSKTLMVQFIDKRKNITLFRTGVNPDLFWKGKLSEVFESPHVLKIMHASTNDCFSLYKDGVKVWNVYDTAAAFNVMEFQKKGRSMYSSQQISFNNLCAHFNVPENPLKDMFKNILWKMELTKSSKYGFNYDGPLKDELKIYCAGDVDPLIRLHSLLDSEISPAYKHLVGQLSDLEIIRAIDPDLIKNRKKTLKNMEAVCLFLSNLPRDTCPPTFYSALAGKYSDKHVYTSPKDRTGHVIFDNRPDAVDAWKNFQSWATVEMLKSRSECDLVVKHFNNEVFNDSDRDSEQDKAPMLLLDQPRSRVMTPELCSEICSILIKTKCPVVMDFSYYKDGGGGFYGDESEIGLVMYLGVMPAYKMLITEEIINSGLRDLLESDCIKVIPRIDSNAVHAAFKLISSFMVEMRNLFDVNLAAKALDFVEFGQSWFQQENLTSKNLIGFLRCSINTQASQQQRMYTAYLALALELPTYILDTLDTISKIEIAIACSHSEKNLTAKHKKMDIKRQHDEYMIHIRILGGNGKFSSPSRESLERIVMEFCQVHDMDPKFLYFKRSALVQVKHKHKIRDLLKHLEENMERTGLRLKADSVKYEKVIEKPARKQDMRKINTALKTNLDKLQNAGLEIEIQFQPINTNVSKLF